MKKIWFVEDIFGERIKKGLDQQERIRESRTIQHARTLRRKVG
jgi:hypothetical protein